MQGFAPEDVCTLRPLCAVCFSPFPNGVGCYQLCCFHIFCQLCLQETAQGQNQFQCPFDNTLSYVSQFDSTLIQSADWVISNSYQSRDPSLYPQLAHLVNSFSRSVNYQRVVCRRLKINGSCSTLYCPYDHQDMSVCSVPCPKAQMCTRGGNCLYNHPSYPQRVQIMPPAPAMGGNQPFPMQPAQAMGGNQFFSMNRSPPMGGNQPFPMQPAPAIGGNQPFPMQPVQAMGGNQPFPMQPVQAMGGNQPFPMQPTVNFPVTQNIYAAQSGKGGGFCPSDLGIRPSTAGAVQPAMNCFAQPYFGPQGGIVNAGIPVFPMGQPQFQGANPAHTPHPKHYTPPAPPSPFLFHRPARWYQLTNPIATALVTLQSSDKHHKEISALFHKTSPNAKIVQIDRVRNHGLYTMYAMKHEAFSVAAGRAVKIAQLFHGTSNTAPKVIYDSPTGLDSRVGTGMWGQGTYYAVNSSYSVNYANKLSNGDLQMFCCSVIIGDYATLPSTPGLKKPPANPKGGNYHSVQGNTGGSDVFITYEPAMSYPTYLITFHP